MMASKLCDSCKSSTATLFCRPDSAFLCLPCDSAIHSANNLASRHPRVPLCEVCEHAPAHVTCKADAASLCFACDHDIHSANPLAARHERVPVVPFFYGADHHHDRRFFGDDVEEEPADVSTEEAEAASWLLPNPKGADLNSFSEMEPVPFVDLGYDAKTVQHKSSAAATPAAAAADGVVPVQSNEAFSYGYKFYNSQSQSQSQSQMSHSVSSSEAGVVPDENTMTEIYSKVKVAVAEGGNQVVGVAADREARVLRYREKRKNRKFEKTIRYASRKAYAETRPRIKGRFAKRSEADSHQLAGYGIVPTC